MSVSPITDDYTAVSEQDTMDVQFNRLILDRVIDVRLNADVDTDGKELSGTVKMINSYRVVAGLYSAQMLRTNGRYV